MENYFKLVHFVSHNLTQFYARKIILLATGRDTNYLKMHSEKYTLTWHSYPDYLREIMQEMMTTENFTDVTIVTDDQKTIKAHRNILSACSPVFKNILQIEVNNCSHPVIYLRGIQHSEIESILRFIYLGEANLYEERMNEFLSVSKNLEIKQLCEDDKFDAYKSDPSNEIQEDDDVKYENITEKEIMSTLELEPTDGNELVRSVINIVGSNIPCDKQFPKNSKNVHAHIRSVHDGENRDIAEFPPHALHEDGGNVETQAQTEPSNPNNAAYSRVQSMKDVSGEAKFQCKECERMFNSYQALRYHTKSKHEGEKYVCNQCDQQFTALNGLTIHIQSKHEGVKYPCNQCDYQATKQGKLTTHIQSIHEGVKYACNQCDKQYTQKFDMTKHIESVHEGVKYACSECGKQFTFLNSLKKHIHSIHDGIKYACKQCDYHATRKDTLTAHMKNKH